jgi:hypothetical protein
MLLVIPVVPVVPATAADVGPDSPGISPSSAGAADAASATDIVSPGCMAPLGMSALLGVDSCACGADGISPRFATAMAFAFISISCGGGTAALVPSPS